MTKDQAIAIVHKIDNFEAELRSVESGLLGIRMQLVQEFRINRNDAGFSPHDPDGTETNAWKVVRPDDDKPGEG